MLNLAIVETFLARTSLEYVNRSISTQSCSLCTHEGRAPTVQSLFSRNLVGYA